MRLPISAKSIKQEYCLMNKMQNPIKAYEWGSKTALTELFGIENPDNKPMAELWMGAHPSASSLIFEHNRWLSLYDTILAEPELFLGKETEQQFGELPFLFKVLCADKALSIQVHPDKTAARQGFDRENIAAIPLDAIERNYKDANHKPELIFALTPFWAMNGFRLFHESQTLLMPFKTLHPAIKTFVEDPNASSLSTLFTTLLQLDGEQKNHLLTALLEHATQQSDNVWALITELAKIHPNDLSVISPLLLNVIELKPFEAMFLDAKTPHAYLKGVGLEIMANSDNVLRAGLTNKHIDVAELIANIDFIEKPLNNLKAVPQQHNQHTIFAVPVDDFTFSVITFETPQSITLPVTKATILFCINGSFILKHNETQIVLNCGQSCFIRASDLAIQIQGSGQLAKASC